MRSILPKERVFVALSVPYNELNLHLTTMINVQCHLVWMDAMQVNKNNYFNFIWMSNDDDYEVALTQDRRKLGEDELIRVRACPPSFMIFFDLNPAQLEHIHQEFVVERNWNLELIDSYSRVMPTVEFKENRAKSSVASKRSTTAHPQHRPVSASRKISNSDNASPTTKSNEEFFYICQFRNVNNTSTPYLSNSVKKIAPDEIIPNKLRHSIIDTRFKQTFNDMVKANSKQMYIPIRIRPLVYNVNTIYNKHLYYTSLYKPVDSYRIAETDACHAFSNHQLSHRDDGTNRIDDDMSTSQFSVRMGLNDLELVDLYNHNKSNTNLKLCDLKAYKDEKQITRFLTIWTSHKHTFYEGISQLFIGLNKSEVLAKINEMSKKNLHPRIITNYGYLNAKGEHVYAVFFCQF